MISRRNRRPSPPTEQLRQFTVTGQKGVDVARSNIDMETMLEIRNMEPDTDGGLVLRKPLVFDKNLPEINGTPSKLLQSFYMYDSETILIIRKTSNKTYLGVFKNNTSVPLRLSWSTWEDYTQYFKDLNNQGFIELPYVDFSNASIVNTATSTILTNISVDIANPIFRRADATYSTPVSTDLMNSQLYDIPSTNKLFRPRTVIISKSTDATDNSKLDLYIVTPDINTINPNSNIPLDPNLDLDNPYAIRDVYSSSAPAAKSIMAFVPTIKVNDNITRGDYTDSVKATEHTTALNSNYIATGYEFDAQQALNAAEVIVQGDTRLMKHDVSYTTNFSGNYAPAGPIPNVFANMPEKRVESLDIQVGMVLNLVVETASVHSSPVTTSFRLEITGDSIHDNTKTREIKGPHAPYEKAIVSMLHHNTLKTTWVSSRDNDDALRFIGICPAQALLECFDSYIQSSSTSTNVTNILSKYWSAAPGKSLLSVFVHETLPNSNFPRLTTKRNIRIKLSYYDKKSGTYAVNSTYRDV